MIRNMGALDCGVRAFAVAPVAIAGVDSRCWDGRRHHRAPEPAPLAETSKARELVALGASVGSNSHPLLQLHSAATPDVGFAPAQSRRRSRWLSTRRSGQVR